MNSNTGKYGPPLTDSEVHELEKSLGLRLPLQYVAFLRVANGGVLPSGAYLYDAASLGERNETWEIRTYAPDFLAIGDTGGGKLILVPLGDREKTVFMVGDGSLLTEDMVGLAPSLAEWLSKGGPIDSGTAVSESATQLVDVFLECAPPDGAIGLLRIKGILKTDNSLSELKKTMEDAPHPIVKGVPYGAFRVRCRKANEPGACLSLRRHGNPSHRLPI